MIVGEQGMVFTPDSLAASGPEAGLYVLLVRLGRPVRRRVGALGPVALPAGWVLYTGSARRHLRHRLARHLAPEKTLRWHIDYLTTAPGASPLGGVVFSGGGWSECSLNRRMGELSGMAVPVPGFGAGDCRAGCPAHLWHSLEALTPHRLARLAGELQRPPG